MRVHTVKSMCAEVAAKYRAQYYGDGTGWYKYLKDPRGPEAKWKMLVELGPNPDPKDVDRVLFDRDDVPKSWSWVQPKCDICGDAVEAVVEMEPGSEEYSTSICGSCLGWAVGLLEDVK